MDTQAAEKAIRDFLIAVDQDPNTPALRETPKRMAELYTELLSGKNASLGEICQATHEVEHKEMVLIKEIPFYSLCEHHLLPFFGRCSLAYIPENNRVIGIGRLAKLVEVVSKKLQLQERMTKEIADAITHYLSPRGVAVVIEARHLCMEMRDGSQKGSIVTTSSVGGIFRENQATRAEFFSLLHASKEKPL